MAVSASAKVILSETWVKEIGPKDLSIYQCLIGVVRRMFSFLL